MSSRNNLFLLMSILKFLEFKSDLIDEYIQLYMLNIHSIFLKKKYFPDIYLQFFCVHVLFWYFLYFVTAKVTIYM